MDPTVLINIINVNSRRYMTGWLDKLCLAVDKIFYTLLDITTSDHCDVKIDETQIQSKNVVRNLVFHLDDKLKIMLNVVENRRNFIKSLLVSLKDCFTNIKLLSYLPLSYIWTYTLGSMSKCHPKSIFIH